ncbi:MAG: YybS family protein [Deltaproteobacteria bacterium]|nr:YybS family protein [Deltaproteobacteria bacterium]
MSKEHKTFSAVGFVLRDPALILGISASIVLFFLMVLFPVFGTIAGIFTPLPLLYFYYRRGRTIGLTMIGLATLVVELIFIFSSRWTGGLMFLGYGLMAGIMAESLLLSLSPEKIIGYPAAAVLGLGLAVLVLSSFFHGQSPWAYGRSIIKSHVEETFYLYRDILTTAQQEGVSSEKNKEKVPFDLNMKEDRQEGETRGLSINQDENLRRLAHLFIRVFPGLTIIGTLLLTWINFMAARLVFARTGMLPPHLANLKKWKAPEFLVWAVILFGFCVVFPVDPVRSIGINGLMVLALVYFFGGLSVVAYWFDQKAVPRFFRVLTYLIIALQQYLGLIVVGLGLFDLWFDFRKLKKAQSGS